MSTYLIAFTLAACAALLPACGSQKQGETFASAHGAAGSGGAVVDPALFGRWGTLTLSTSKDGQDAKMHLIFELRPGTLATIAHCHYESAGIATDIGPVTYSSAATYTADQINVQKGGTATVLRAVGSGSVSCNATNNAGLVHYKLSGGKLTLQSTTMAAGEQVLERVN